MTTYGPWFYWFAWRPVWTEDRGWRWLRFVWRRMDTHRVPLGVPEYGGDTFHDWQHLVQLDPERTRK